MPYGGFYFLPKSMTPNDRKRFDVLVIRVTNDGELANSRPCNHCIMTMREMGIRRVFYSDENGKIICEKVNKMEMKHICSGLKQSFQIKKITEIKPSNREKRRLQTSPEPS